jgi:hypothetical protein
LLQGYARDQSVIGADLIREVAAELGLAGAGPAAPSATPGGPVSRWRGWFGLRR